MKFMIVLSAVLAMLPWVAGADPIDPEPDGIGVYFDEAADADSWCTTATPGSQVTAYLCLTRAVDVSGFTAWEGRLEVSPGGTLTGFVLRGAAVNAAVEPEFVVALTTPLPYQISTVLLEMTVDVGWEYAIGLRVWPAASPRGTFNLPAYEAAGAPGTFRTLQYSLGWNLDTEVPNWCAAINDDTCLGGPQVATEQASWGGLKALYRD